MNRPYPVVLGLGSIKLLSCCRCCKIKVRNHVIILTDLSVGPFKEIIRIHTGNHCTRMVPSQVLDRTITMWINPVLLNSTGYSHWWMHVPPIKYRYINVSVSIFLSNCYNNAFLYLGYYNLVTCNLDVLSWAVGHYISNKYFRDQTLRGSSFETWETFISLLLFSLQRHNIDLSENYFLHPVIVWKKEGSACTTRSCTI